MTYASMCAQARIEQKEKAAEEAAARKEKKEQAVAEAASEESEYENEGE